MQVFSSRFVCFGSFVACVLIISFSSSGTNALTVPASGVDCGNWTSCWTCALGRTSCIWDHTNNQCSNSADPNIWTNVTSCSDRPAFIDALSLCVTTPSEALGFSAYDQIVDKNFFSCDGGGNACSSSSCTDDIQCLADLVHAYEGHDCYPIETDTSGTVGKCNSTLFSSSCASTCSDFCTSEITRCSDWHNCWTCATGSISCIWSSGGCTTSSNINVWTNATSCTDTPDFLTAVSKCYSDRSMALSYSSLDVLASCDASDACSNSDCKKNLQCLTDSIHSYNGRSCYAVDGEGSIANCNYTNYLTNVCRVEAANCTTVCTPSSGSARTSLTILSALVVLLGALLF